MDSEKRWTLNISGLRICNLKIQKSRLVKELLSTFTRKPKLFVRVWNADSKQCVRGIDLEGYQTSSITGDMKWPGEVSLNVGQVKEREKFYAIQNSLNFPKVIPISIEL